MRNWQRLIVAVPGQRGCHQLWPPPAQPIRVAARPLPPAVNAAMNRLAEAVHRATAAIEFVRDEGVAKP